VPQPRQQSNLTKDALAVACSMPHMLYSYLATVSCVLTEVHCSISTTTKLAHYLQVLRKFWAIAHCGRLGGRLLGLHTKGDSAHLATGRSSRGICWLHF